MGSIWSTAVFCGDVPGRSDGRSWHPAEHRGEQRRCSVEREDRREEAEEEGELGPEEHFSLLVVVKGHHVERKRFAGDGALPVAPDPVFGVAYEFELFSEICGEAREEPPGRAGYHIA